MDAAVVTPAFGTTPDEVAGLAVNEGEEERLARCSPGEGGGKGKGDELEFDPLASGAVEEGDAAGLGAGDGECTGDRSGAGVRIGDGVREGDGFDDRLGVGEGLGLGEGVGVGEGIGDGEGIGEGDGCCAAASFARFGVVGAVIHEFPIRCMVSLVVLSPACHPFEPLTWSIVFPSVFFNIRYSPVFERGPV